MRAHDQVSRREFIASNSALLAVIRQVAKAVRKVAKQYGV